MSIASEIRELQELKESGVLTEQEFVQAKKRLLSGVAPSTSKNPNPFRFCDDASIGQAANRYVSFRIVMGIIGAIIFLIMFFLVFLPMVSRSRTMFDAHPKHILFHNK